MQIDAVYLAAKGFEEQLYEELLRAGQKIVFQRERLLGVKGSPVQAVWAQNIWLTPRLLQVSSINDAAKVLKKIQRNWILFPTAERGRSRLIQEKLPVLLVKPQIFGAPLPTAAIGSWTMWDKTTVIASAQCSSPYPNGEYMFVENLIGPPNRAYLKLWEGFTRLGKKPCPGDLCVELGSAPGGWTWVLAELGARVFSIDKAPLDKKLMHHPLIEHCKGSAFALEPEVAGEIDWLFSDVVCYPERLLQLVERWLDKGHCQRFFCTVKFSGSTDFATLERFLSIPGSRAIHLFANKHEVTWIRLPEEEWVDK